MLAVEMAARPLRYAPERPLPPYAFRRGTTPHPRADPDGHSHGPAPALPAPLDPGRWMESADYRFGFDLFNHGYYWEAHEAWEGLWTACGKRGAQAEFLKGLIKLAAAALKLRSGEPVGTQRHARSAAGHLAAAFREFGSSVYAGLGFAEAIATARDLEEAARGGELDAGGGEAAARFEPQLILRGDEGEP